MSTRKTSIIFIFIILIIIPGLIGQVTSAKQLSLVIPLDGGDYTIHHEILITAKSNNTKIMISLYNITNNYKNNYILDMGLYNIVLDVKLANGTLYILTYTELLKRKIIIVYSYNLSSSQVNRIAIDVTDNIEESIKGGNIVGNNIIIINKYKILVYNIINKSLVNSINIMNNYKNMYIDEVNNGIYIVYITNSNKSIIYYYNGTDINMININYIVLDIDDNKGYISVYNETRYAILSFNYKKILSAKGIIGSLCHIDNIVFYSISYKGTNALMMLNLSVDKNYLLVNSKDMIIDISCTDTYLVVSYTNRSIQVFDYNIIKDAVPLEDSSETVVNTASSNNITYTGTTSSRDERVTYLKVSSLVLGVVVIVLAYKIVRDVKNRY